MKKVMSLRPEQLKKQWNMDEIPFDTTKDLEPLDGIIGQERAVRAMEFGTRIRNKGYNIFITGISGTGKTSYAREFVQKIAREQRVPKDWCYVYNFDDPSQPQAIELDPGQGQRFQQDMKEFIENVRAEIVKTFNEEEYENQKAMLLKEIQQKRSQIFNDFNQYAQKEGFEVNATDTGIYFTPIVNGNPIGEEEYKNLDEELKKQINEKLTQIQLQAVEVTRKIRELEREARRKSKELENRVGLAALELHMDGMKVKYQNNPKILHYLENVKEDILSHINEFKGNDGSEEENPLMHVLRKDRNSPVGKYTVNLLVDRSHQEGAPVIIEYMPTYQKLFGSIEYENKLGTLVTDFTMIKPGSLHYANGGYLILQAKDVLTTPFMWEGLKKVLKTGTLCLESLRDQWGLMSMSGLKPEPIPIDLKVILIGSSFIYQLLYQLDEDFPKLFKVKVDFDDEMDANLENLIALGRFIAGYCQREGCRHFTKEAVIRIAEYSSRLVENQEKLSTRFGEIVEILAEANSFAERNKHEYVEADDVLTAIREKEYRANKLDEKLMELLKDEIIMVDTEGKAIGQINGLSVLNTGDFIFGKPSRITATTYIGKGGVVNIEREVQMSGTTHSKGVMILSSYIGEQYAQEIPLTMTANITFEQLYSGVDGDSASSTELYAILSSLSEVPIRQDIAVTGSVNQKGEIQPVGGVTYKVEGFFALCKARGLTGTQGVIIPEQNIKNLVLKDEVIEAVREGKFHIYPVKTIDEGIEILTGIPAGKRLKSGHFEKGSIHERVYNKLRQYALIMANFGKSEG